MTHQLPSQQQIRQSTPPGSVQQQPSQPVQRHSHQSGQVPEGSQGYSEGAQSAGTQGGTQAIQTGTQASGQMLQQPSSGPAQGLRLDDALTNEMRVALHDFVQAANVTEWCAEQCIDEGPQMAECIRLCRDVADLAEMNMKFLTRDSAFGPDLVDVFVQAADACARECAQHSHAHCQECVEVLSRAIISAEEMLASFQGGQQATMQSQSGQSFGSQSGQSMGSQVGQSMGSQGSQSMQSQGGQWMQPQLGQQ